MKIAVLGTGVVGQALAARLDELGHDVVIGTRDPRATLARDEPDAMGNPPLSTWLTGHPDIRLATFAEAAANADLLVNATAGGVSLAAVQAAGEGNVQGKVLLDVANALDFSNGFPPTLSVANTDSVAEQLQRAFPGLRVVKALNTMTAAVMVDPARLSEAHHVLMAGDDDEAKSTVSGVLQEMGWPASTILDLGGLRAARGCEMYLPLWLSLMQTIGSPDFNIKVVRA